VEGRTVRVMVAKPKESKTEGNRPRGNSPFRSDYAGSKKSW